jgi:hypothetical protein
MFNSVVITTKAEFTGSNLVGCANYFKHCDKCLVRRMSVYFGHVQFREESGSVLWVHRRVQFIALLLRSKTKLQSFKVYKGQYGPVWAELIPARASNLVERQRQVYQDAELKVTVEE